MASSLVQFRTEDTSRIKAASICEQLGIDLPTYLRACIARLIQERHSVQHEAGTETRKQGSSGHEGSQPHCR